MEDIKRALAALASGVDDLGRAAKAGEKELADARRAAESLRASQDAGAIAALKAQIAELNEKNRALEEKMRAAAALFGASFGSSSAAPQGAGLSPPEAGAKRRVETAAGGESAGGGGGGGQGSLPGSSVEKRGRFSAVQEEVQPPQLNGAGGQPLARIPVPHRARQWWLVKWGEGTDAPAKGAQPPEGAEKIELVEGVDVVLGRGKHGVVSAKVSREQVAVTLSAEGKVQMRVTGMNATSIILAGQKEESVSVGKEDGNRECKHGDIMCVEPPPFPPPP
jgi:hypothetical protein